MIRHTQLEHRFVEHLPESLQPGILYISIEFGSVAHSCCCGCGEEIVTPLTPTDWRIVYDGESITLAPSVGNWNLPCRSHYIIKQGRAIEALPWTDEQVVSEQQRDRMAKARYYQRKPDHTEPIAPTEPTPLPKTGLWNRAMQWLRTRIRAE